MINILEKLATYLATRVNLALGQSLFYNQLSDTDNVCVLLQEVTCNDDIAPQINLEQHTIKVCARASSNTAAYNKAAECYRWLLTDNEAYTAETAELIDITGILALAADLIVRCQLGGTPIWLKTDDKGREYFGFTATIFSKRLI